jgi:succinate dehydrogenase / fumarate reductase cytochrome b subunit
MSEQQRPISPHLSVYRWPITMALSIIHRITGIALTGGLFVVAVWLVAAASGAADYGAFVGALSTLPGQVLLAVWSFAFFFHLANGVRHLIWDMGYGFDKQQAQTSSWVVIVFALVFTLAYWQLF